MKKDRTQFFQLGTYNTSIFLTKTVFFLIWMLDTYNFNIKNTKKCCGGEGVWTSPPTFPYTHTHTQ